MNSQQPKIVLASASPRRRDLLAQIGIVPVRVIATDIDESERRGERAMDYARRMAVGKASAVVASLSASEAVIAGDTVVVRGRTILPKAENEDDARRCLAMLSGRRHRVLGGIALGLPGGNIVSRVVASSVIMKRLEAREVDAYIATGDWEGKAGGYAIQGPAAAFIRHVEGSYSNIVGLSLYDVAAMLRGNGLMP